MDGCGIEEDSNMYSIDNTEICLGEMCQSVLYAGEWPGHGGRSAKGFATRSFTFFLYNVFYAELSQSHTGNAKGRQRERQGRNIFAISHPTMFLGAVLLSNESQSLLWPNGSIKCRYAENNKGLIEVNADWREIINMWQAERKMVSG